MLAKVNHLEILSVTPEGLRPIKQFTINGQVQVMKFFRPKGADKDRLFVVTARHLAMILETSGDGPTLEVVTKAYGNVGDRIGKRSETGTLAIIDPDSKVIALRIYDALLKVSSVYNNTHILFYKQAGRRIEFRENMSGLFFGHYFGN